uniref:Dipeptidyl peptidase 9 n=1 Tax=Strigamia maritima TaxID=126957 RepID=T1J0E1_STRMM
MEYELNVAAMTSEDSTSVLSQTNTKTWLELRQDVREMRSQLSNLSSKVPSNFQFRTAQLPSGTMTRIYFLSPVPSGRETTLYFIDVPETNYGESPLHLEWNQLLQSTFQAVPILARLSKEEQLQCERMRLVTYGITSYEVHLGSGRFVFPACSSLFSFIDGFWFAPYYPSELKTTCNGARLNSRICPYNPDLVAYVCNSDIWIQHLVSGSERRLTFTHKGCKRLVDDPLSAGIPAYVIQEEFNRYLGFWWQTQKADPGIYRILYEEVDETDVEILHFANENGGVEEYRFPRAGTPNAKSTLKILQFQLDDNDEITELKHFQMVDALQEIFSWMEYLVRVGWTPDGKHVWAQLLNRRQKHLQLVLLPFTSFTPVDSVFELPSNHVDMRLPVNVLLAEDSEAWINVHDILHFFPQVDENLVSFIWASERTGFRHLYLITCDLTHHNNLLESAGYALKIDVLNYEFCSISDYLKPCVIREVMLTNGDWEILDKEIWVDEVRQLIYFTAFKDTPLEKHFYVVSLKTPGVIRRLTETDYSHAISMDSECNMFVTVYSNIKTLPASRVYRIYFPNNSFTVDSLQLISVGHLLEASELDTKYQLPELFSCQIKSGDILYGLVFKPPHMEEGKKIPTILSVYGGPEVQLVTNTFKGLRQLRLHMLAHQGYVVIVIDSRGSRHRGLKFESHIKDRMGTVEIADQAEVLEWLGCNMDFIDMNRIAIHGWSYGGYLSLMGLAQRPDIFKIAIAGAPVTSWTLYDTGYTERYMDEPSSNKQGYKTGSVLSYVSLFPNEENRLLIIHGLIDENVHFFHTGQLINALVRAGKPYHLQVYPNERHSLRHLSACEHYETNLLSFLQTWL